MATPEDNGQSKPEDLTYHEKIKSVSDVMLSIEDEINAIKTGELKESQGRLVMKGRGYQLKAVDLYLQAARIEPKLRSQLAKRMGRVIDVTPPPPPKIAAPEQPLDQPDKADA